MQTYYMRKKGNINLGYLRNNARYLAGLIDGEGSFCILEKKGNHLRFSPLISLQMTHEQTVSFTANVFNVTFGESKKQKKAFFHKDVYRVLVTTKTEIGQIAKELLAYSITKRKQIELMINYLKLEEEMNNERTYVKKKEILKKVIEIFIELKMNNERGEPKDYELMRQSLLERLGRESQVLL